MKIVGEFFLQSILLLVALLLKTHPAEQKKNSGGRIQNDVYLTGNCRFDLCMDDKSGIVKTLNSISKLLGN